MRRFDVRTRFDGYDVVEIYNNFIYVWRSSSFISGRSAANIVTGLIIILLAFLIELYQWKIQLFAFSFAHYS